MIHSRGSLRKTPGLRPGPGSQRPTRGGVATETLSKLIPKRFRIRGEPPADQLSRLIVVVVLIRLVRRRVEVRQGDAQAERLDHRAEVPLEVLVAADEID